jgi:uncharacterized protein YbjT (DUF2867 family)
MKILISAPTGIVGRKIVPELLAPEFFVRVITRNPSSIPREIRDQVDIVHGSATDLNVLREALEGIDALFWSGSCQPTQESNGRNRYERFVQAASDAVSKAGTARVVAISTSPASASPAIEDILNESGAAIRHLRFDWFMENLLQQAASISGHGLLSFPLPPYVPIPMIAAKDIADVALRFLVRTDWGGIEALSVKGADAISFYQTAALVECIWGRPVRYEEIPTGKYRQAQITCGVSTESADAMLELFCSFTGRSGRIEPASVRATTPTTLTGWLRSELLPLLKQCEQQKEIDGASAQILERKTSNKGSCREFPPERPQFFESLLT